MTEKFIQDALIIWATIDPIGTMAIFTGLTAGLSPAARTRTAIKAILYAAVVLVGSIVVGQLILSAMGIQLVSFQIAGGLILFLFGLQMIFRSDSRPPAPGEPEPEHDIAVFPLAILAVILLTDNHVHPIGVQLGTTLITLAILGVTLLLLLLSGRIIRVIGNAGASILTRVMGMILAALSVELVLDALGAERWLGLV